MLDKKDKADIKDIVVEVIKDVLMPTFEHFHTDLQGVKRDLQGVKRDLYQVKERVEQIDRKLDIFSAKTSEHTRELAKLRRES